MKSMGAMNLSECVWFEGLKMNGCCRVAFIDGKEIISGLQE
jgi:hypothetical protein